MRSLLLLIICSFSAACATSDVLNTITTSGNELNAAFTPDGKTVYFTRTSGTGDQQIGKILFSTRTHNGRWSTPAIVNFSGTHSDYDPFVSPDGSRLFFISRRPRTDFDLWFVERKGNVWSEPQHLDAPLNSEGDELYPAIAADGTLYFSSCGRADSRGRCDLYRSRHIDGRYATIENLGNTINTSASETDAYIAPDQSYLIFTVYGDGDLYISLARDGVWTAPRALQSLNTSAREYCPIVSPDGRFFYFTRQRDGAGDVLRVPIEEVLPQPHKTLSINR